MLLFPVVLFDQLLGCVVELLLIRLQLQQHVPQRIDSAAVLFNKRAAVSYINRLRSASRAAVLFNERTAVSVIKGLRNALGAPPSRSINGQRLAI